MTALNLRREAGVEAAGAIRTAGFVLDPYRACLAALDASVAKGANVFERSEVLRIRARTKSVEVATEGGTVSAATVVIAGGASIPDLRPLRRHLQTRHGYAVVTAPLPAPVKRELGARSAVLRLGDDPPQFVRWLPGDRALVEGADQDPVPAPRPRAGGHPAVRPADVRAVADFPGNLRYTRPNGDGGSPSTTRWTVSHTSAATGISRATCSPSASAGMAPPHRGWPRGYSCGSVPAPRPRGTICSVFPEFCSRTEKQPAGPPIGQRVHYNRDPPCGVHRENQCHGEGTRTTHRASAPARGVRSCRRRRHELCGDAVRLGGRAVAQLRAVSRRRGREDRHAWVTSA